MQNKQMNKYNLFLPLITILSLFPAMISAQTIFTGIVRDARTKEPLPGVNIVVKESWQGTVTDQEGQYQITFSGETCTILFSSIGYESVSKEVSDTQDKTTLNVLLKELVTEINEVKVTGKSKAREIREQAMPISVITMHELQGTVSDVSDVLSKTSGVQIRSSGGEGSTSRISVRGLEGKRIGFFIDETPLNDQTDFLDLNDIPIDLIDRVEIYKGIVPAKFGGSAVGGAVNIVLKEYPPSYLDASYSLQSFNTHKASTIFKRNKNGYEFGLGGFYTYSDNNYEMELPLQPGKYVTRDHDKFRKLTIGGGFTSRRWWFDEVVFEPAVIFTKKEIQGIEYNIQEATSFADAYVLANHSEKTNFFIEGLDLDFSNAYAYTIYCFQDKAKQRYSWDGEIRPPVTDYGGEIGVQPNDVYNQKHTFLQKTNLNYLMDGRNSINFNSQYNFARGIPSDTLLDKVIGYKTLFNSSMNSWVTGLSHEFNSTNKKFTNAFTIKYYYYSMQTRLVDLYRASTTTVPEDIDMKNHDFGISNAIRYRISPDFLVKSSMAHDVRLPAENELLGDGFIIAPSGNLEPERNTSFNLGFMYDLTGINSNRFQVELNGFYMHLEDMIRFTGGPLQSKYENFGEMRTLGAEIEAKWDVTNWLYIWGNTTYQDLRDTREYEPGSSVPNPTKGDRIPNIPYFFANAGIELHAANLFGGTGQNTRWFTDGSFVEEYFYDFEQSIYQERRIPRTFTINSGIEHSLKNQSVFISLQANNLTNAKVLSEFNRPLPGLNFGMKVRYVWK
ncbi:TonB-dependent receptor [Maribellus maritimus]|uniref:TonB-dependent receptor n=1 Tax=Maribellus maritimus TaxID=2870838 RepID=UPI001EE9F974|nr:TonB-dependent receptor plug domain-containing protein [Maribellus maritimus]MCG6190274.1 TonB-dependent receptor plug domain-containing protein [Maribellus maritimus]